MCYTAAPHTLLKLGVGKNEMQMNNVSKAGYRLLYEKAREQQLLNHLDNAQIRQALDTCISIYSDFEVVLNAGFTHIIVRHHKIQTPINIVSELTPALATAHIYFGDSLPEELVFKLTNKTQISDTIFELNCLGTFQRHHEVVYEPNLQNGKIPDLMLKLNGQTGAYIECKSQHILESEYNRIFNKFTSEIFAIMKESPLPKIAFEKNFRTEVHIKKTPNQKQIAELRKDIKNVSLDDLKCGSLCFGENIILLAVPKQQPYDDESSMHAADITVRDKPTSLHHKNAHLVIYSWPGLDVKRRRIQRKLLSKARKKLMNIPKGYIGMICLQTYGVKRFMKDLKDLLPQEEFRRIPFVWLNPFHESQLVCRNEYLYLRDKLFKG